MKGKLTLDELLEIYKCDDANCNANTKNIYENLNDIGAIKATEELGIELIKRLNDESILKTIDVYLDIAKIDLNDYKILFDSKSYANAIYHLEQSIEKVAKGVYFLLLSNPSPKKISHRPFNVIVDFIKEYKIFKILEKNYSPSFLDIIDNELGDENKILKINKSEFENFMKILDYLNDLVIPIPKKQFENNNDYFLNIGNHLVRVLPQIYIFSKLLYLHESYTRYPDAQNKLQPSDYTLDLGIVDLSLYISDKIQKTIDIMIDMIEVVRNNKPKI